VNIDDLTDRIYEFCDTNRTEEALAFLDSKLFSDSESTIPQPYLLALKAKVFLKRKDYEQVECLARSLISDLPEFREMGWTFLAESFYGRRNYDEAIACYRKSLDLADPDTDIEPFRLHVDIAFCYYGKQDYPNALRHLNLYAGQNEPDAEAHRLFGKVYTEMEQFDLAEEHLRMSFMLEEGNDETCCYLGRVLREKHAYKEALEYFQRALGLRQDRSSEHATLLWEIGSCLFKQTLKHCQEFQGRVKNHDAAWSHWCEIRKETDSYKEALELFRNAWVLRENRSPEEIEILNETESCLSGMQDLETSERYLKMALEIDPNDFVSHCLIANVLGFQGKISEAEEHHRFAISYMHPDNPELFDSGQEMAYGNYAAFLASNFEGRDEETILAFEKTLALNPLQPPTLRSYGEFLLRINDREGAIRQLSKSAEQGDEKAKRILESLEAESR